MSVLRELERGNALSGLRLKRKLGQKIIITHKGDTLILQIAAYLGGWQVMLVFHDEKKEFHILRGEAVRVEVPDAVE